MNTYHSTIPTRKNVLCGVPAAEPHTLDDYLSRLQGVTPSGDGYKALCPAHDDRNPSLSVGPGKNGHPVLYCHAGCSYDSIIAAMGLERSAHDPTSTARQIVATYDYRDESGALLYQKVRYVPKDFRIRRPDGNGGWNWSKGKARPVLYRLPELLAAKTQGQPLFLAEGEKDADRLHAVGLTATTNIEGASEDGKRQKWQPEYSDQLAGAVRVVLLPDNDDPGRALMRAVAQQLAGKVADIRLVELPGLPSKGDVSDWLDAGHTVKELLQVVEATEPYQPGQAPPLDYSDYAEDHGYEQDKGAGKPIIDAIPGDLHIVVRKAERALLEAGVGIYQRVGVLVRPATLPTEVQVSGATLAAGTLVIEPVSKAWLAERMNEAATWRKYNERKGGMVKVDCPAKYAEHYLAKKGEWNVRVLIGIVEAPLLRRDGSLLDKPGYDPVSGLYLNYTGVPVSVPDQPTKEDAIKALAVLKEPFEEFPFVSDVDRSVALSDLLTAVNRRSLRTVPYHAIDAPAPGTGKGLLVDVCALVATGRVATSTTLGADETEAEKRLGALLMRGVSFINLDNAARPVEGDFLCSLATQETVDVRILGQSATATIPSSTAAISFTGNNLVFKGDMTRRVLLCRIDPRCEKPDALQFKRNLHEFVPTNRHRLLSAALTVLRAYICAGSPAHGKAPYGSFEQWDRLIRGALLWLGQPDPLKSRECVDGKDPAAMGIRSLLETWFGVCNTSAVTVHELVAKATPDEKGTYSHPKGEELRHAILEVAGNRDGTMINPRALSHYLRKNRDRVAGEYRLEETGKDGHTKTALWCVVSGISGVSFASPENFRNKEDIPLDEKDGVGISAKKVAVAKPNTANTANTASLEAPPPPAADDFGVL